MNNLGRHCKDKITGFEGIITSEHRYLTGCTQYGVQPKMKEDGVLPEKQYFDITRCEVSGDAVIIENAERDPGCDHRERP